MAGETTPREFPVEKQGEWTVVKPNIEKLKEAGLNDEQIAALDMRNGGNIDDEGNVLFLDENRLARKEHPELPMYQNKADEGSAAEYLLQNVMCNNPENWELHKRSFNTIIGMFQMGNTQPGVSTAMDLVSASPATNGNGSTHVNMLPVDIDLTDDERSKSVVLPIDLIDQVIDKAPFIAKMDKCVCRDKEDCQDYPHDCACLFFNMAGKKVVGNRLAHELTHDEAKKEVRRAVAAGLIPQALWIEVEQVIWGFPNSKMSEFFEICFCCPCCCVAMTCARVGSRQAKFMEQPSGFTAVVNHTICEGCKTCSTSKHTCPVDAIAYREDGKCVINQEYCIGCGICRSNCPNGAIKIKQTMPMRSSIHEYFEKEASIDLTLEKCTVE